ncbi:fumarylacetoacetate hydrolase family protein [Pantoea phytobeneficialis]|uniref:2-hydroxyhepta-2,4-diene-1,7-dioate isomerase n=1 Tax=Pantoea phytobeneficialis TaxID=2052056 RepID=A0AAP9H4V4_9GAMM|nr:fumarylacetoacetate hydrolase family protein [Pantoea phytobeneficialis]MDO6405682.1 fumarylacetoacetate hydrolase family protein [Pantoea phytobeneficialis]QGR06678.1 2-hydroxyhepta-2,4-diene-1,7-dioate isomerase [Pantoea phytobeneficialis]
MERPQFIRFSAEKGQVQSYGLISGAGVIDLKPRFANRWPTLDAVIADNALTALAAEAKNLPVDYALTDIQFEMPLEQPGKILCIGVNYPNRNAEYKDGQSAPDYPSMFVRFPESLTGHQQPLLRPAESEQLDYEGEVVMVIGKSGRRIPESEALNHIAAITLGNEGTVRDWVRHSKFNVTQGKNFYRSGAIGPWLVPFTEAAQIADIRLTTHVNGELRQDDRTCNMTFSFRWIIAYISTFIPLNPGDIIFTGTPTGAGARFEPPVWLKPGDVIEVHAEGIGTLRNHVKDEV